MYINYNLSFLHIGVIKNRMEKTLLSVHAQSTLGEWTPLILTISDLVVLLILGRWEGAAFFEQDLIHGGKGRHLS